MLQNFFELLLLQLGYRFLKYFRVHVESHIFNKSALLAAQEIARASDLEVLHGYLKARSEVGELGDRLEPLLCSRSERMRVACEQVSVRLP